MPELTRQRRRPTTHGESPLLSPPFGWLVGASALLVLGTYAVRMDRVYGLYIDDAWYLLLAAGMLTIVHFRRDRGVPPIAALGLALATVASPAFVFFAASTLMSAQLA